MTDSAANVVTLDKEVYDEYMSSLDPLLDHLYREGYSEQVAHLDDLKIKMEETQES